MRACVRVCGAESRARVRRKGYTQRYVSVRPPWPLFTADIFQGRNHAAEVIHNSHYAIRSRKIFLRLVFLRNRDFCRKLSEFALSSRNEPCLLCTKRDLHPIFFHRVCFRRIPRLNVKYSLKNMHSSLTSPRSGSLDGVFIHDKKRVLESFELIGKV